MVLPALDAPLLLALEAAWRFRLRPRLSWDADGFTSTGALGRSRRCGWAHLLDVEADRRAGVVLMVRTGEAGRLVSRPAGRRRALSR